MRLLAALVLSATLSHRGVSSFEANPLQDVSSSMIQSFVAAPHAIPSALVHTGIGAASGATGAFVCYPIDLIKTRLQTEIGRAKYGSDSIRCAWDIVLETGPLALYRGVLVQIAGIAPEKTIKLFVNDFMRTFLSAQMGGSLSLVGEVAAGGVAGLCQDLLTCPLEVVKCQLQTSSDTSRTVSDIFVDIGGFKGLYKGLLPCVARDVVFSSCLFPSFAHLKEILPDTLSSSLGHEVNALWCTILAGAMAAGPAAFIATPFDTVKTRIQQAREVEEESGTAAADIAPISLIKTLDVETLFSGVSERVIRSALQFGVTLSLFDLLTAKAGEVGLV